MIAAIRAGKPGDLIPDRGERASVRGLQARVLAGGEVSFYFYYRTKAGKQRRPKIGTFGEITVAEARARAKDLARRVAVGEDPRGDWENKRQELTIGDLFDRAWGDYWSTDKVSKHWAYQVKMNYENHIKNTFGSVKATDLLPKDLKSWLRGFEETPYAGNRSLEVLSKLYRLAQEEGLVPLGVNPCSFVRALPEKKRGRFAKPEELAKIGELLEARKETQTAAVAFIYLLMFSGTRPSVIERAKWEQLEELKIQGETWGRLVIHGKTSSQTGEQDVVILPPQAMAVVLKLPRVAGATITGIKSPRRLWLEIREQAGCKDLWVRDFRRTFATVGLSDGEKLDTIGELLNHRSTQTTKIYAKLMEHARIKAAGAIASKIESILEREQESLPALVVPQGV